MVSVYLKSVTEICTGAVEVWDIQDEIRVRGNVARETPATVLLASRSKQIAIIRYDLPCTIAVVTGDIKGGLLADLHLDDALIPT